MAMVSRLWLLCTGHDTHSSASPAFVVKCHTLSRAFGLWLRRFALVLIKTVSFADLPFGLWLWFGSAPEKDLQMLR